MRRRSDRLGTGDVVELVTDVGPVPRNVGALLVLEPGARAEDVLAAVRQRMAAVPRLRRRLAVPPWWRGRPHWSACDDVDGARHVVLQAVSGPGDEALLALTADVLGQPLPRSAPLWRAVVVTDGDAGAVGVVIVLHHVVADGIAGLGLLEQLVDGPLPAASTPASARAGTTSRPRPGARRVIVARPHLAPRCSLVAATGPRRSLHTADVDLAPLRAAARRHAATVNDVLLVAVTGAMREVLAARGEHPPHLVVSVPVAVGAAGPDRGNRVAVMPVRVPLEGGPIERLHAVAGATRAQKRARSSGAALFPPVARALAAVGLFQWFIDRQRLVNSFLSNLRGPAAECRLAGYRVIRVVPVSGTGGNVAVAFGALSYAGGLVVTVITDPDVVPEGDRLATALQAQLEALRRC